MTKPWGIFTLKNDVEWTVQQVKDAGLQVFEVRELTFLEKLTYCKGANMAVDMWIVMFYATEEEYNKLVEESDLTKVF